MVWSPRLLPLSLSPLLTPTPLHSQELFVVEMNSFGIMSRICWASANVLSVLSVSSAAAALDSVNRRSIVTHKFPCPFHSHPGPVSLSVAAEFKSLSVQDPRDTKISTLLHSDPGTPLWHHLLRNKKFHRFRCHLQSHLSHRLSVGLLVRMECIQMNSCDNRNTLVIVP
jgi:hypothetical protein